MLKNDSHSSRLYCVFYVIPWGRNLEQGIGIACSGVRRDTSNSRKVGTSIANANPIAIPDSVAVLRVEKHVVLLSHSAAHSFALQVNWNIDQ